MQALAAFRSFLRCSVVGVSAVALGIGHVGCAAVGLAPRLHGQTAFDGGGVLARDAEVGRRGPRGIKVQLT